MKNLRNGGVSLSLADIWLSESGIYLLLNNYTLIRVLVHKGILADKEFQTKGVPCFHFMPCQTIQDTLQSSMDTKSYFFASLTGSNSFTFKISTRRAALSVHHDAPLEVCEECLVLSRLSKDEVLGSLNLLNASLYSPQAGIKEEEYQSLFAFFKNIYHHRCSCCEAENAELFLAQDKEGSFYLICNQHQQSGE